MRSCPPDAFHAERPDLPGLAVEQLRKGDKPSLPLPVFISALCRLAEAGEVVLDRGDLDEIAQDHFFLRSAVERMAEIAIDLAAHGSQGNFTAADFQDRLDNGRKVAIQILEFFNRHGFTVRRQDRRRINPARTELFAPKRGG